MPSCAQTYTPCTSLTITIVLFSEWPPKITLWNYDFLDLITTKYGRMYDKSHQNPVETFEMVLPSKCFPSISCNNGSLNGVGFPHPVDVSFCPLVAATIMVTIAKTNPQTHLFQIENTEIHGCQPKNNGTPKMDGENNGKPYEQMDDLWAHPYFRKHPHLHSWWILAASSPHHQRRLAVDQLLVVPGPPTRVPSLAGFPRNKNITQKKWV